MVWLVLMAVLLCSFYFGVWGKDTGCDLEHHGQYNVSCLLFISLFSFISFCFSFFIFCYFFSYFYCCFFFFFCIFYSAYFVLTFFLSLFLMLLLFLIFSFSFSLSFAEAQVYINFLFIYITVDHIGGRKLPICSCYLVRIIDC